MHHDRFKGTVTGVSPRGDYGFVRANAFRPVSDKAAPIISTSDVFVHVEEVGCVNRLMNGLPITFAVITKAKGLAAADVETDPRFTGFVHLPSGRYDIGFIDCSTVKLHPSWTSSAPVEMPDAGIFVHARYLRVGPLIDGMQLAFCCRRTDAGKNAGKLQAFCIEQL